MAPCVHILILLLVLGISESRAQEFARGADVGWLSEMEASGKKFYGDKGEQQDLLQILNDHCINSIRLRVWVNPANGWCNKADVVAMAKRASAMGFRIMIDFHYSDSWADPGKQTKPAAWASFSNDKLSQAIYDHTLDVLNQLKQQGVSPEWCQIGNETNDGMLWDNGRASTNMATYAKFVTSGHNAAHAVFPSIITIVHVANGFDNDLFTWNIGGLVSNGASFDAVGMSLYPDPTNWQTLSNQCLSNMTSMVNLFSKPVMVSEIGMSYTSPTQAKAFVEDIIAKNMSLPGKKGLGVFWWEPQTYNWRAYDKGAFDLDGRPTLALDGFQTNCSLSSVKVRFVADFSSSATPNGAFITGTMTSDGTNWAIHPLRSEGNNVFSTEFVIQPGSTGAYYLLNAADWASRETVPPACATWYTSDRGYTIGTRDTTIYLSWGSCTASTDCHGTINGTAAIDACGRCSGGSTGIPVCLSQQIQLNKGWNLISTNIHPADSSVTSLFGGMDVAEVKDMTSFWRAKQLDAFNSLKTIESGRGYLVNMNNPGVLNLTGFKNLSGMSIPQSNGSLLIGTPYQSATPFARYFNASNCRLIKNLSGFWNPQATANSIDSLQPGSAYFFYK